MVPFATLAWYRLQRYAWYRFSAIGTLSCNREIIDYVTRTNDQFFTSPNLYYNVAASLGMTVPIWRYINKNDKPILGFWGYGTIFSYHGGGYLTSRDILAWYHAAAPEMGVIFRVGRFALNYKCQYILPIKVDEKDDYTIPSHPVHSFGIGFTW